MRGWRGFRILLVGCLLWSCRSEPVATLPIRLVEDPAIPRTNPMLDWGTHVALGSDSRPAISTTRGTVVHAGEAALPPRSARGVLRVRIPPALRDVPWIALQPLLTSSTDSVRLPVRVQRPWADEVEIPLGPALDVFPPGSKAGVLVEGRAVPNLEDRDILTGPIRLPPGAVLRFAIAIEQVGWNEDPLEFTVTAVDGSREMPLFRRLLDPSNAEADRGWREERVLLDSLAGRRIRFRLAARSVRTSGIRTSFPLWGDPVVLPARAEPTRPSVVLVSLDTLRARSVSAYGAKRRTTPALDGLVAARGAVFDNAIAPAPHTLASHMSLLTGLYPKTHGVVRGTTVLAAQHRTLAELLREAGYETAAFTEDGFIIAQTGFLRGFALYTEDKSPDLHNPLGHIRRTFARGREWLTHHADRPFFLFLHTYQVHRPYTPPVAYQSRFGRAQALSDQKERDLLLYEQEISYADEELRAVLQHLDALGLADRTLLVVTSDHGEAFMEHGQWAHGFQLYDEALHVPLVMRLPGVVPAARRVNTPVSLVDVTPTVLDLLGVPSPHALDGLSLAPLLREPPAPFPRAAVFAQARDLFAVRTVSHKCIFKTPTSAYDCFDLTEDPGEQRAVAMDGNAAVLGARDLLAGFMAERPALPAPGLAPAPDAETEKKLRALGYL